MKKNLQLLLIVLVVAIFSSCRTVRETIPVKERSVLSKEQIINLEAVEIALAEARYDSLINQKERVAQPSVSNVFVQTNMRSALMDLMTQTGINIIVDNTVNGEVSLILEDVPLEKALEMMLYPGGYEFKYVKDGNYYLVGKTLPENSSFDRLASTKVIKTNGDAEKILSQISPFYHPYAKASGQTITIMGPEDIIFRMERDISIVDKTKRQIEITAQFIMIEWNKGTNLGAQWSDINLSAIGLGDIISGGTLNLAANLTSGLSSFLSANGYDTKIKTVAEPRIVVEEGEKAELKITEEHLFLILSGGGAAYNYFTTKEVEVGIKLDVRPYISRDGEIRLIVNPEVADIVGEREFKSNGGPSQKLPIIARRSTQTTVKVINGETFVIGGLITKSSKDSKNGVPFFRKIPIINLVLGKKDKSAKETELVVFLTPRVID